jgi:hypothetical protein
MSYKTKVAKHTTDPIFEETFEFENLDAQKLDSRYIEISIHEVVENNSSSSNTKHFNSRFDDSVVGVTSLKLNHPGSFMDMKKIYLKEFRPSTKTSSDEENYVGDLMFSLTYLPAAERLTIVVMKARNLCPLTNDKKSSSNHHNHHQPDPCVKVCLMNKECTKKLKKKKTSSQKCTQNPTFNEEIVFTNLKKDQLNDICILFVVMHDSLTSRQILGSFSINSESRSDAGNQWRDMLNGKKSAWWHKLIPDASYFNNSNTEHLQELNSNSTFSSNSMNNNTNNNNNQNNHNFTARRMSNMKSNFTKIKPLSILSQNSKQILSD